MTLREGDKIWHLNLNPVMMFLKLLPFVRDDETPSHGHSLKEVVRVTAGCQQEEEEKKKGLSTFLLRLSKCFDPKHIPQNLIERGIRTKAFSFFLPAYIGVQRYFRREGKPHSFLVNWIFLGQKDCSVIIFKRPIDKYGNTIFYLDAKIIPFLNSSVILL